MKLWLAWIGKVCVRGIVLRVFRGEWERRKKTL